MWFPLTVCTRLENGTQLFCRVRTTKETRIDFQVVDKNRVLLSAISINVPAISLTTSWARTSIFQQTQSTPSNVDVVAWAAESYHLNMSLLRLIAVDLSARASIWQGI